MIHREAEQRVKALQKEFLLWLEDNIKDVGAVEFEKLRRSVFRGSFKAFRLGVVGLVPRLDHIDYPEEGYLGTFSGGPLVAGPHTEIQERYFRMALEAFRLGTLVSKESEHAVFNA